MENKHIYRALYLVITVMLLFHSSPVFAQSAADIQRKYLDLGVEYYDTEVSAGSCGVDGVAGGSSGDESGGGTVTGNLKSFVDAYGQYAYDNSITSGVPYDFTLAQAILESGYGDSGLTKQANNFFGIKAGSSWTGPTIQMPTKENIGGVEVWVTGTFRKYASPEEGFKGHDDFLRANKRYAAAFQYPNDPYKFLAEVKKAGYATDPGYIGKVSAVIKSVQAYIASTGKWPPSSEVKYDVTAPPVPVGGVTTGSTTPSATCDAAQSTSALQNTAFAGVTETMKPTAIVLHWWGGTGGIDSLISTLDTRGLSVQFASTVDGRTHQLTPQPNSLAQHAKCANPWAIGNEIEGGVTFGPDPAGSGQQVALDLSTNVVQFKAVVALTGQLMRQFNIPLDGALSADGSAGVGVHSHKEVDKNCSNSTGKNDVDDVYLKRVKDELRKQGFK